MVNNFNSVKNKLKLHFITKNFIIVYYCYLLFVIVIVIVLYCIVLIFIIVIIIIIIIMLLNVTVHTGCFSLAGCKQYT